MDFIKNFADQYGVSFLVLVVISFVIAMLTEVTIKKAFEWLEKKLDGKKWIAIAKIVGIQLFTWALTIWFSALLVAGLPFPGSKVLFPVWLCLVYFLQYLFSCWGIKGFLDWLKKRAQRKAEKKAEKEALEAAKPQLVKVAGTENLYTDGQGHYYDAKGRRQ